MKKPKHSKRTTVRTLLSSARSVLTSLEIRWLLGYLTVFAVVVTLLVLIILSGGIFVQ